MNCLKPVYGSNHIIIIRILWTQFHNWSSKGSCKIAVNLSRLIILKVSQQFAPDKHSCLTVLVWYSVTVCLLSHLVLVSSHDTDLSDLWSHTEHCVPDHHCTALTQAPSLGSESRDLRRKGEKMLVRQGKLQVPADLADFIKDRENWGLLRLGESHILLKSYEQTHS